MTPLRRSGHVECAAHIVILDRIGDRCFAKHTEKAKHASFSLQKPKHRSFMQIPVHLLAPAAFRSSSFISTWPSTVLYDYIRLAT